MSRRFYLNNSQPSPREMRAAINQFAELLSRGFSLNECARWMSISRGSVCVLLHELCALYSEPVFA